MKKILYKFKENILIYNPNKGLIIGEIKSKKEFDYVTKFIKDNFNKTSPISSMTWSSLLKGVKPYGGVVGINLNPPEESYSYCGMDWYKTNPPYDKYIYITPDNLKNLVIKKVKHEKNTI